MKRLSVNESLILAAQLQKQADAIRREHPYQHGAEWHNAGEIIPGILGDIAERLCNRLHKSERGMRWAA